MPLPPRAKITWMEQIRHPVMRKYLMSNFSTKPDDQRRLNFDFIHALQLLLYYFMLVSSHFLAIFLSFFLQVICSSSFLLAILPWFAFIFGFCTYLLFFYLWAFSSNGGALLFFWVYKLKTATVDLPNEKSSFYGSMSQICDIFWCYDQVMFENNPWLLTSCPIIYV